MKDNIEFECRKLNVNVEKLIAMLNNLGAEKVGEYWQKRVVYDFKPAERGRWVRLRSNGIKTFLTVKEIVSLQISGTKELEVEVSDFDTTKLILQKMGYEPRSYQENYRIEYSLNGVNIDIDKWPLIPMFVEVEGYDDKSVLDTLDILGFDDIDVTTLGVDAIYSEFYSINLDEIKELKFSDKEKEDIKLLKKNEIKEGFMDLYIGCAENKYELYNNLKEFFAVEILEEEDNTMGIGDLKILFEPISKCIETLGNVLVSVINMKRCTIKLKNGDKELIFEGNPGELENEAVIDLLAKMFEE